VRVRSFVAFVGKWSEALTPQVVRYIVKRRAELAGLTSVGFSTHSLRSGFMTEAGRFIGISQSSISELCHSPHPRV
jgi:site-specific recombinase XerD